MSFRSAFIRWDLRVKPASFELNFWRSTQTLRALQLIDTVASMSGLVHVVSAVMRYIEAQSNSAAADIKSPPFQYVYAANILAHVAAAALPLLLMTSRPAMYKAHRSRLIATSRMLLLITTTLVLCSSSAASAVASALAARTTSEQPRPLKALLLNITHPGVYILQQAMFLVPFRWALLLQLINFGASLLWSARLPCLLSLQHADDTTAQAVCSASLVAATGTHMCLASIAANIPVAHQTDQTSLFFQAEATETCLMLNYMVEYLNSLFGIMPMSGTLETETADSPVLSSSPAFCQGVYAIQTLQVFVSMLMFLVVPLSLIFWWEYTWKRCYLESINADNSMQIDSFWSRILERLGRATADPAVIEPDADDSTAVLHRPPQRQQPGSGSVFGALCLCIAVSVLIVYAAWVICIGLVTKLQKRGCAATLQ